MSKNSNEKKQDEIVASEPKDKTRRGNGEGCLHIRGNLYWARWMYHGEVYDRSTKIRVDMKDENGNPCGREIATAVMQSFLEPFKHRAEADTLSLIENRIKSQRNLENTTNPNRIIARLKDIGELFANSSRRTDINKEHLKAFIACANEFARWAGGNTLAQSITPRITSQWADYIWNLNYAPHTFNGKIAMMRQTWQVLKPIIGFEENPWSDIKKRKNDEIVRRCITDKELERIYWAAGDRYGGDAKMLITIGENTGMRIGDCAQLKWSDIDFNKKFIFKKTEKTGEWVPIPILPQFMNALLEHKTRLEKIYEEADRIGWEEYWEVGEFPDEKTRLRHIIDPNYKEYVCPRMAKRCILQRTLLSSMMRRIFQNAGIETSIATERGVRRRPIATFHSLRSRFVSKLAEAGVSQHVAKKIVGHRSTEISEHYTHISDDFIMSEMMKLTDCHKK